MSFKNLIRWMIIATTTMTLSCANIFKGTQNTNTDEAIYEDAMKAVNDQQYDTAIALFRTLSTDFLYNSSRPEIRENFAGALAGRCGFSLFGLFDALDGANSSAIFKFMMNMFTDMDVNPDDCLEAETVMKTFGSTSASRTTNQNFFMALLGLAKVGIFLRSNADRDGVNGWGDGSADATFSVCNDTASTDDEIDDGEMAEIISGLGLLLENMAYVTAAGAGGDALGDLSGLQTQCQDIADDLATSNPCTITDSASVSPEAITMFRALLKTAADNDNGYTFGIHEDATAPASCDPATAMEFALCCP